MKTILSIILVALTLVSCGKETEKNQSIQALEKQIAKLIEENKRLQQVGDRHEEAIKMSTTHMDNIVESASGFQGGFVKLSESAHTFVERSELKIEIQKAVAERWLDLELTKRDIKYLEAKLQQNSEDKEAQKLFNQAKQLLKQQQKIHSESEDLASEIDKAYQEQRNILEQYCDIAKDMQTAAIPKGEKK